ncbi:MAG: DUF4058 family protein [Isosphaeraceae bacterium]
MPDPCPFPGMDPFLEAQGYWRDFHASFLTYLRDALNDRLPGPYDARIDERVHLVSVESSTASREFRPDVAWIAREDAEGVPNRGTATAALLASEPVTVPLLFLEEERETYIKIYRDPERTLVAVIELLSPSNKVEPGYREYLAKRDALLRQPIHLVELDFLIGGQRLPLAGPLPGGDYYALVARGDRRPDCEVYAWSVRHPLPKVAIPLRDPDPDLVLDLAEVFTTSYERGRYARSIDYKAPLALPLKPEDRAWAEGLAGAL